MSRRSGVAGTSSWEAPIASRPSVFSRFRLAGLTIIVGLGLVGTTFYGLLTSHYLGRAIGQTLGPYSDALAEHALANRDPVIWQKIAERHGVALAVESPDGTTVAFDNRGEPFPPGSTVLGDSRVQATRTAPDGTRVTLYWSASALGDRHASLLLGWLVMLVLVVGASFWFLQRQLRPLAVLHDAVGDVARGNFDVHVPIARQDEIGRVAGAFNEMARQVGQMVDDRERMLVDVSHELRSPLARMKVALELMPPGSERDALDHDVKEMEALTTLLLEREALRSRTARLEGQEVELDTIATQVVAAAAEREPGVRFAPGVAVSLHADPVLLKLLLQNLVDNAIKFSRADSAPALVELETTADAVELRVLDDGIGIPGGQEQQVFEPFVKLDRSRGHHVGYGIGLDLCRRIVELHGGTIRLQRREPRGTAAIVRLPRRRDAGGASR